MKKFIMIFFYCAKMFGVLILNERVILISFINQRISKKQKNRNMVFYKKNSKKIF